MLIGSTHWRRQSLARTSLARTVFLSGLLLSGLLWGASGALLAQNQNDDLVLFPHLDDPVERQVFVRGDVNLDGVVSLGDVFSIFRHLHLGLEIACPDAADTNDSGHINQTDAIYLLTAIFARSGRQVPAPFGRPGYDETGDSLPCNQGIRFTDAAHVLAIEAPTQRCRSGEGAADLDFIESYERVRVSPGQERIRVPVFLQTSAEIEGFSLSVSAPADKLTLNAVGFGGGETIDSLLTGGRVMTASFSGMRDRGFLASTLLVAVDPTLETLPAMPQKARIGYVEFSVKSNAEPGESFILSFRDTPADGALPPLRTEISRDGVSARPKACGVLVEVVEPGAVFLRGDANRNSMIGVSDAMTILRGAFVFGVTLPCPDAADVNDDGQVQVVDALYLLNYLFLDGPRPVLPYPVPGIDSPDEDGLPCAEA